MTRKHYPISGTIGQLDADALTLSGALSNGWLAHVRRRAGLPNDSAAALGLLADVRWTVVFVAFLGYVFAITTYRLPIATLAIVAGIAGLFLQPERLRFAPLLIWLGAFLLWCAIGYVRSAYPLTAWDGLVALVKLWAIVLVCVNALRSRAQLRFFCVFFLACFALFPLRGAFFNYFFYKYTLFGRAVWNNVFRNPNDLAALTILQLSMAAALLATEQRWWVRRAAQAGVVLLPLLVLMTESRGGFIALTVFTIFCVVGQWRQLRSVLAPGRRVRVMLLLLGVIFVVAFFAPNGLWERLRGLKHLTNTEQLNEVDPEGSARQRYEIWRVAMKIIREHPLTGVGVASYPPAHAVYAQGEEFDPTAAGYRDTHSTYLNVLAETGIPGGILFFGLVLSTALGAERVRRKCMKREPRLARPLFFLEIGLLAFFAAGVFGSLEYFSFLYIHLALLWTTARLTRHELASSGLAFPNPPSTSRSQLPRVKRRTL